MSHPDDILVWPDGTWYARSEPGGYAHKSDDYEVLQADSEEWFAFDPENPLKRWES